MAAVRRMWQFPPMTDELSLAAEFPPTSEADWRKLVEAALKGASFDKRLVSQTYDGLRIEPLYPRAVGAKRGRRAPPGAAWHGDAARSIIPIRRRPTRRRCTNWKTAPPALTLVFAGSLNANGYGTGRFA